MEIEQERDQSRDALIRKICKYKISAETFGRIKIEDSAFEKILTSNALLKAELSKQIASAKNKEKPCLIFGIGLEIFRKIKKLENGIEEANNGNFNSITEEQLKAIRGFQYEDKNKENASILFKEKQQGVHAEMQILGELIKNIQIKAISVPNDLYIGISKRCCLNCHHMLNVANKFLTTQQLTISYEGSHDGNFSQNWHPPFIFLEGIKSVRFHSTSTDTSANLLAFNIGKAYAESIETSKGTNVFEQRHPPSDSDFTPNAVDKITLHRNELTDDLAIFKKYDLYQTDIGRMLVLGLKLCDVGSFNELFELSLGKQLEKEAVLNRFFTILAELNSEQLKKEPISDQDLLKCLQDLRVNPAHIVEYFSNIKPDDLTLVQTMQVTPDTVQQPPTKKPKTVSGQNETKAVIPGTVHFVYGANPVFPQIETKTPFNPIQETSVLSEKMLEHEADQLREALIKANIASNLIKIIHEKNAPNSYQVKVESNILADLENAKRIIDKQIKQQFT